MPPATNGCVGPAPSDLKVIVVDIDRASIDALGHLAVAAGDDGAARRGGALRAWLYAATIEAGPIFRPIDKAGTVRGSRLTDRSVANIVKAYAARAGFDAGMFRGEKGFEATAG